MNGYKIKVAIAGLDSFFFSQMFAKHLQSNPSVELVGCTTLGVSEEDIVKNNGLTPEQFSQQFHIPVYNDIESLLAESGAEAVCLTTRPSVMPQYIKILAERNIHVYAAKPVAVSEEGLAVLECVLPEKAVISAGPTARFDPVFQQARAKVANGDIGTVTSIRVMHQHGMLKFWPNECWYYEQQEGGIEFFLSWYCSDLLRWFTGQEMGAIHGIAANLTDHGSPHADVLKAVCRLSGGALASIDILFNVSWPYPMFEAEVIGTKGALRVQQDAFEGTLFNADGALSFGKKMYDSLSDELADWIKACRGEKQPALSWHDVLALVRAGIALHRNVKIPS